VSQLISMQLAAYVRKRCSGKRKEVTKALDDGFEKAALPDDRVRGERSQGGLDGLGSVPGSSRNRRPRIAAPNPTNPSWDMPPYLTYGSLGSKIEYPGFSTRYVYETETLRYVQSSAETPPRCVQATCFAHIFP